ADAIVGALNVGLFYCWLRRFERISGLTMTEGCRTALTLLFGLGTVHFYLSCVGRVWFASQIVTLTFVLAACIAVCSPRLTLLNAGLTGLFLTLAALTRNVSAVFGLFFVAMIWLRTNDGAPRRLTRFLARTAVFAVPCLVGVAAQAG